MTAATNDDLRNLAELPRLETVVVVKTAVTKEGVTWMDEKLPNVDVFAGGNQK